MLFAFETSEDTSSMAKTLSGLFDAEDEAFETDELALEAVEEAFDTLDPGLTNAFEAEELRLLLATEASSTSGALLEALDALEDAFEALDDAFDTVEPATLSSALLCNGTIAFEFEETLLLLTFDDTSSIFSMLLASDLLDCFDTVELFSPALPCGTMAFDLDDTVEPFPASDFALTCSILSFADRPSSASSGS